MNKNQKLHACEDLIDLLKETQDIIYFIPDMQDVTEDQSMIDEYELLGYFVTKHPLDNHKRRMLQLESIGTLKDDPRERFVHIGGIISDVKEIKTKAGKMMAFLTVEDMTARIEVVVFPNMFEKIKHLLIKNKLVEVKGKLEIEEKEINDETKILTKIMASGLIELEHQKELESVIIKIVKSQSVDSLKDLKSFLEKQTGETKVFVEFEDFLLEIPYKIKQNNDTLNKIREYALIQEIERNTA